VSSAELHAFLEREFRGTAAGLCRKCAVPKPVFPRSASGASNWRIGAIEECDGLCHTILQDVAAKLAAQYSLKE
jgi:hypothetical protein